ncbi:MAG TPA: hypothetical protein PKY30_07940 [Myxococcota bacterium]|nr:hypothetical protein [Myxococcota bacterium]HNH46952.1 hypothetical protein [Myxococcota bacterium]
MDSLTLDLLFTSIAVLGLISASGLALSLLPWSDEAIRADVEAWERVGVAAVATLVPAALPALVRARR